MQKPIKHSVDRQINFLRSADLPPAAILLSKESYLALLQELAYDKATDDLEPIGEYDGVLVVIAPGEKIVSVVPNAEVHWHNVDEIDSPAPSARTKEAVRFTEL